MFKQISSDFRTFEHRKPTLIHDLRDLSGDLNRWIGGGLTEICKYPPDFSSDATSQLNLTPFSDSFLNFFVLSVSSVLVSRNSPATLEECLSTFL